MVDRPGVFDTLLAWHPLSMAPNKTPCQCLYSTFDPFFCSSKSMAALSFKRKHKR